MKLSTTVVLLSVSIGGVRCASAQTIGEQAANDVLAKPAPPTPSLFREIGHDVPAFFSTDTFKILGAFTLAGLAVHPVDNASVEDTSERVSKRVAGIGNWGGSLYVQAGGGLATYFVGRATGNAKVASFGGDIVRSQVLSQLFVQGAKFAVERQRPDGSNALSFPSGHSASAFATATVVQRHFGWKAGIPAYTFASLVGASRMASSKHYFSDVLVGAGIGIAAGRTVTLGIGHNKFDVGAAPTAGGAMVTFTKR